MKNIKIYFAISKTNQKGYIEIILLKPGSQTFKIVVIATSDTIANPMYVINF